MDVMLQIGSVQFTVPALVIQSIKRSQEYRYASNQPISGGPVHTYLGIGKHTVSLQGVIYAPYLFPLNAEELTGLPPRELMNGGIAALRDAPNAFIKRLQNRGDQLLKNTYINPLEDLERLAESGIAHDLYQGDGKRLGKVFILGIDRDSDNFTKRGGVQKQTFSLDLEFAREDHINAPTVS
jgi:phage protein U